MNGMLRIVVYCRDETHFSTQSVYKRTNTEKALEEMSDTYPVVTKNLFNHWLRLLAEKNFTGMPTINFFGKF